MPYISTKETEIKGAYLIQPRVFGDNRGWYCPFAEIAELKEIIGTQLNITQIAGSYNAKPGILRGLHYQKPNTQGKLVWAARGSVFDVIVDIRQNSPTFGRYFSAVLTAEEHNQLWVPPGMAHGYLALKADTEFNYIVTDGCYNPPSEKGVNPFDPEINISWPMSREQMDLKERDLNFPHLRDVPQEDLL